MADRLVDLEIENMDLRVRLAEAERLLRSIAANTCCDRCREAALVAKSYFAADSASAAPVAPVHRCSLELSGAQILDLYNICGGEFDADTIWTIAFSDKVLDLDTGKYEPPGLYAHLSEHPDEGYIGPLGGTVATVTVSEVPK